MINNVLIQTVLKKFHIQLFMYTRFFHFPNVNCICAKLCSGWLLNCHKSKDLRKLAFSLTPPSHSCQVSVCITFTCLLIAPLCVFIYKAKWFGIKALLSWHQQNEMDPTVNSVVKITFLLMARLSIGFCVQSLLSAVCFTAVLHLTEWFHNTVLRCTEGSKFENWNEITILAMETIVYWTLCAVDIEHTLFYSYR